MKIRKAVLDDLKEMNTLLERNGFSGNLTADHMGEECLVGVSDGEIRGLIWASASRGGYLAFIDYFAVDRAYKGLGVKLALAGLRHLKSLGVKKIMSLVENSEKYKEAVKINKYFGMRCDPSRLFHFYMGEVG